MKSIKPIIYTIISGLFIILTFKIVFTDFENSGFDKSVLATISAIMGVVTGAASLKMWISHRVKAANFDFNVPLARWRKLLVACGGIAFSITLLSTILGLWFFDPDIMVNFIENYLFIVIPLLGIIVFPFVNKHLD